MKKKGCKYCKKPLSEKQQKDKRISFCNIVCRKKYNAEVYVEQNIYDKCKCGNRKVASSKKCRKCHVKRGKGQLTRIENSWKGEKGVFLI